MKSRPQPAPQPDDDLPDEILELARLLADIAAAEQTAARDGAPADTQRAASEP